MKDIVKLYPLATITIAGHSTLRGVSMGTLIVRVTDAQGFLHMFLLAMMYRGLAVTYFRAGRRRLRGLMRSSPKSRTWTLASSKFHYAKTLNALQ